MTARAGAGRSPAPGKPQRRSAAQPEVVDLYRLLYQPKQPLTVADIAENMPPAYKTHANLEFRKDGESRGYPIKSDWTAEERHTAWFWWIRELITRNWKTKMVIATDSSGAVVNYTAKSGKRLDELAFRANTDTPPVVADVALTEVLVTWTPEIGETGKRHAAGMAFLNQVGALLAKPKLPDDIKQALELAESAIRVQRNG